MLLTGQVADITGGGRGKFAGEGAAVVVAARTKSEIEAVAREISDAGGRAAAFPADVAEENIAAAALFLCSGQASAITGQSLNVDGGTAFY